MIQEWTILLPGSLLALGIGLTVALNVANVADWLADTYKAEGGATGKRPRFPFPESNPTYRSVQSLRVAGAFFALLGLCGIMLTLSKSSWKPASAAGTFLFICCLLGLVVLVALSKSWIEDEMN
jgi:hypothetical protein